MSLNDNYLLKEHPTPGPWHMIPYSLEIMKDGILIADLNSGGVKSEDMREANARLIVLAPELKSIVSDLHTAMIMSPPFRKFLQYWFPRSKSNLSCIPKHRGEAWI